LTKAIQNLSTKILNLQNS